MSHPPRSTILSSLKELPTRRPGWVLLGVLAVSLASAALLPRLRIDSSMETIFLEDDPERAVYEEFKKTFGEDEVVVIALKAPGGVFTAPTLRKIDQLSKSIQALPKELGVDRVVSLTTVDDVQGSEGGFETGPFLPQIPEAPESLAALRQRALDNPLYVKNLISSDGTAAAINVFLDYRPGDRTYKERLLLKLRELVDPLRGPEELHFAGIPVLTVYTSEYLRRDMAIFIPLSILVMGLTLFATFRRLSGVLLPLCTVGIACLWTLGFVAALGESISILSSVIPSLILTLGCAYSIHVFSHYLRAPGSPQERVTATVRHVVWPVFLSGITTVMGFFSLVSNNVTQVREFGLYSAFGIFAAMFLAAVAVPAALHYLRPRGEPGTDADGTPDGRLERALDWLVTRNLRRPWTIIAGTLLVIALGAVSATRLEVDTDYASNFKPSSAPVQGLRFMRENLSGERPVNVVLHARTPGENAALEPSVLKAVEQTEQAIASHPLIATQLSIAAYLKNMNQAMHEDDPAQHTLPVSRMLASQYLDLYGRPGELRRYLSDDRQAVVVVGRSSIISSREFLAFMERLRDELGQKVGQVVEVTVTGSMYLLSKASIEIAVGQAKSLALASLSILLALVILFRVRSWKYALVAFLPNFIPVALNFGVMGALGVPLTTATSIVAGMALGIVDDDTIHFLTNYRELREHLGAREAVREVIRRIGRPVVFTTVTNALGFLVLTLSSFAPLVALGWTTALTMVTALLGDLLLLPALLVLFDTGQEATEPASQPASTTLPEVMP